MQGFSADQWREALMDETESNKERTHRAWNAALRADQDVKASIEPKKEADNRRNFAIGLAVVAIFLLFIYICFP